MLVPIDLSNKKKFASQDPQSFVEIRTSGTFGTSQVENRQNLRKSKTLIPFDQTYEPETKSNVHFNVEAPKLLSQGYPQILFAKNNKISCRVIYTDAASVNTYNKQIAEQQKVIKLLEKAQNTIIK